MIKILLLSLSLLVPTAKAEALPNPLTLEYVLKLIENQNLEQRQQQINVALESIKLDEYLDIYKPKISLDVALAERADYGSSTDNSHGFIKINQMLFNQNTNIGKNLITSNINSSKFKLKQLKDEKFISIIRAFFDVVLADMRYETILEQLALSAVHENRVKDDFDIEHASEVELLEKKTKTQLYSSKRIEAESKQIYTRAKLAQLLNISYEGRPDDLVKPKLSHLFKKKLDELEVWQKKVLKLNPVLKNMERVLSDLKKQLQNEKDNYEITISSSARLGEQSYQRDKNGKWRIGINLTMPIGQSHEQKRKLSSMALKSKQQQLLIEKYRQDLNQDLLSVWLKLKTLEKVNKSLIIELDYRDLYLERSRANYELEIKSDIGHAMINLTDTEWKLTKNEFDYATNYIKLLQLAGEEYEL